MTEKKIFNYLYGIGCCKACCLRHIFLRSPENFTNVDDYIKKMQFLDDETISEEVTPKKIKNNPCIVCLGLLQDYCIDEIVEKVAENEKIKCYDSTEFTCSVSFPPCVQIREHSIMQDLEKRFSDFFTFENQITRLNKTWKWMIKDKLAEKLNKNFENSDTCIYSINITVGYELNEEELSVLLKMQPKYFNSRTEHKKKFQKTFRGELFSRKSVLNVLEMTNTVMFKEHSSVPPSISNKQLFVEQIDCIHNSIYIAGRYCKFSRALSQTPWVINGVKLMETSVQELIFDVICKKLQITDEGLKFSSSGREDVDVRCLGIGRPFYLEVLDPKKTRFSYDEFRELEDEINKNKDIKVRDLQIVARDDLVHIKEGEESKTKQYEATCISRNSIPPWDKIKNLEKITPLVLKQKTPIRVLHRRPLAIRQRSIVSIKAEKILDSEDNVFKLYMTTQAGTYVKEFVHGDFGRTIPNISQILDSEIDIIELDVMAIDLDWPKRVEKPCE